MPAIQWVAVEPSTGQIIEPLPGVKLNSSMPSLIGRTGGSVSLEMPVTDRLPARWKLATQPWRTLIVAHFDDADMTVLWAGIVANRNYGSGSTIQLGMVDVYAWLARQYLPTLSFTQVEQTTIMRQIGLDLAAATFHGTVSEQPTGTLRDRNYDTNDDKTRLSAMQDLMRVQGGPEWDIRFKFDNGVLGAQCVVADKIGARRDDQQPRLLSRVEWTLDEDYGDGKGSPTVTGSAVREGDQRTSVTLSDDALLAAGWLPGEYRWQPDTGSVSEDIIRGYVTQRLADIRLGTSTYTVTVPIVESDLLLGRDLQRGDDVEIDLANVDLPELDRTLKARLIGWVAQADPQSGEVINAELVLYGQDDEG